MLDQIFILLIALVLVGMPMLRLEAPWIISPMRATGVGELISMKILIPILALGTLLAPFFVQSDLCDSLRDAVPSAGYPAIIAISLSALAAILVSMVVHRACGAPYAVMGAIFGCQLKVEGVIDMAYAGGMVGSWLVAIVLCIILAAIFSYLLQKYTSKGGRSFAIVDQRLLVGCVFATLFLTIAASWNLGQLMAVCPVFVLGETHTSAYIAVGILLLLFLISMNNINSWTSRIADTGLDAGTGHILAVMLAMGITFLVFSMPIVSHIGLTPAPLSAAALMTASLTGVALVRGDSTVSGIEIIKSIAACMVSPFLGLMIGYCFSLVLNVGGNLTPDHSLLPIFSLLGIAIVCALLYFYVKFSQRAMQTKAILRSREEQINTAQKSLTALEVKAENTEKDLTNKLEIKRKELVDFAVGVSDQKAFMDDVYHQLTAARALPDGPQRDEALDDILSKIRERMYFTTEMNDFYARTEVLHRDFNMHLKEAYPNLTESERKLANLLRQGFSSKYIASLMNITPKSVEISRYRLRTKLGLSRSDNLVQFIKSI
jgi:DNA-binding CsgD family transcriptional regulator